MRIPHAVCNRPFADEKLEQTRLGLNAWEKQQRPAESKTSPRAGLNLSSNEPPCYR